MIGKKLRMSERFSGFMTKRIINEFHIVRFENIASGIKKMRITKIL